MQETQRRQRQRDTETEVDALPEDQRRATLTEEVDCCLAEIDAVLDQTKAELAAAKAEFDKIAYDDTKPGKVRLAELRVWEAKYAHLGVTLHVCCGGPVMLKDGHLYQDD